MYVKLAVCFPFTFRWSELTRSSEHPVVTESQSLRELPVNTTVWGASLPQRKFPWISCYFMLQIPGLPFD